MTLSELRDHLNVLLTSCPDLGDVPVFTQPGVVPLTGFRIWGHYDRYAVPDDNQTWPEHVEWLKSAGILKPPPKSVRRKKR